MQWVWGVAGFLVLLGVVTWIAHRMLLNSEGGGGGGADAFGGMIDVFDPAKGRAAEELKSQKHQGVVTPSPDEDDRPVRIVPGRNGAPPTIRVRRSS